MKNKILIGATVLTLAATSAFGTEDAKKEREPRDDAGELFRAHEVSLDLFGSGSLGEYTLENWSGSRVRHDIRLGAGGGLNYFFTRNIGIGGDIYAENTTRSFIDSASASLIVRLPLGESGFAPYLFGGGGRQFDMVEAWFVQFGAGMEYRFTPHVGVFMDARVAVPEETKYYGLARLGLRIAF